MHLSIQMWFYDDTKEVGLSQENILKMFKFILKTNQEEGRQRQMTSIRKTVLPGMAIPMLKIRRPNGRLIFNMEITIRR